MNQSNGGVNYVSYLYNYITPEQEMGGNFAASNLELCIPLQEEV